MSDDVVLIGPVRAGKSTVGRLLAERLGKPQCSMDDHCERYYAERPDVPWVRRARPGEPPTDEDWRAAFRSMADWFAHAVERLLADFRDCVFDFGAGHSIHEGEHFDRVARVLAPYPNVVLLLPSPDLDESVAILRERLEWPMHLAMNEMFVRHPSNRRLAKWTVYTKDRTPEETRDEILSRAVPPRASGSARPRRIPPARPRQG